MSKEMSGLKEKKMTVLIAVIFSVSILVLFLAGCSLGFPQASSGEDTQLSTRAAMTMLAIEQSLYGQLTQTAFIGQTFPITQTAVVNGFIQQMTQTAQAIPTAPIGVTLSAPTAIVQFPTSVPVQTPCYRGIWLTDVSYPDNTQVLPGASFIKIWRIQNSGTCTWFPGFNVISQDNGQIVAAMVSSPVPPGGSVDVSVPITVPYTNGLYQRFFVFRATDGSVFGSGSSGNTPIWVKVYVDGNMQTDTEQRSRIQFSPGATGTTLQGNLNANDVDYYILRALQGQTMTVNVVSSSGHALLTIYGISDGIPLVRGNASGATSWQGQLPLTQDYALDIISDGNATDYVLQITIQ